jgi:hypothetical protein
MVHLGNLGLLCLLTASVGCGDGQADGQYRGTPLWSISGLINILGPIAGGASTVRLAFFYSPQLTLSDPEQWVEHLGSSVEVPLPSFFVLNIFDAPGLEHMVKLPSGQSAGYGIAHLLAYVDENQDGRHTPGEPFVGDVPAQGEYYLPQALSKGSTPANGALQAGLYSALLPQPCGYLPPPPTDPGTCGVPIGNYCNMDAQCGSGICLQQTATPWPGGYCTIAEPPPNGCRPSQAVFYELPTLGLPPSSSMIGVYLRPCNTDADCARANDLDPGSVVCDPGLLGCVAHQPGTLIQVGGMPGPLPIQPFCAM